MATSTLEYLSSPLFQILNDQELLLTSNLGHRITPTIMYMSYEDENPGVGTTLAMMKNGDDIARYRLLTVTDVVEESIAELEKFQSGHPTNMTFNAELEQANIAVVGLGEGKIGVLRIRWSGRRFRIRWFESMLDFKSEDEKLSWMFRNFRKSMDCSPINGDVIMMAP